MELTSELKNYFEGKFKSLKDELLKLDSPDLIKEYLDWVADKLVINIQFDNEKRILKSIKKLNKNEDKDKISKLRKEKFKYKQDDKPYELLKGDIINVKFGVGIGDELNGEHYGIILSNNGAMFLIAPLTSTPSYFKKYEIVLRDLNLPRKSEDRGKDDLSYVSYSQIRYIHCRRITSIKKRYGEENYKEKLHIDEKIVDNIIRNYFSICRFVKHFGR